MAQFTNYIFTVSDNDVSPICKRNYAKIYSTFSVSSNNVVQPPIIFTINSSYMSVYCSSPCFGTLFISTDILIGMMLQTARCPGCLQKVEVDYRLDSKVGLAHFFLLDCPSCHWTKTYCTKSDKRQKRTSNLRNKYNKYYCFS